MKKAILCLITVFLLFPISGKCGDWIFKVSLGDSQIDGSLKLFSDYPAVAEEERFSSCTVLAEKEFDRGFYVNGGFIYLGSAARVNFYSGYVYDYRLEGVYGLLGGGWIFSKDGYFLKAGMDVYYKLHETFDTPSGEEVTDILADFFPGFSVSAGKYLFGRYFIGINYRGSFDSVFDSSLYRAYWSDFSLQVGIRM
ncbi:hypothetical protein [Desulfurobacterium sp.]